MLKKDITYKAIHFNDNDEPVKVTRTEPFYFNLTQAEAIEINLMENLESVGNSRDAKAIIPVFKNIIHYSYGVRLPDGKFTKDPSKTTDFLASDAYSELFLGLLQEGEKAVSDFIKQVCDFETKDLAEGLPQEAQRKEPQDYKQKETAVTAAEDKRVTENSTPQTPAEEYRVQASAYAIDHGDTPGQIKSGDYKEDPEYQAFLAYKNRNEGQQDNGQHTAPSPATESPVQLISESPIERPAHETQALRRDSRDRG